VLVMVSCLPSAVHPKFFRKFRKSMTKHLKNAVCETVPLASIIRQSLKSPENKQVSEIDNALLQAQEILESLTLEPTAQNTLSHEENIETLGVTLLTHMLKEKINKEKKAEIKQAIDQLNELKTVIQEIKQMQGGDSEKRD